MGVLDDTKTYFRRQLAPVTVGLMATFVVTALLTFLLKMNGVGSFVVDIGWFSHPWSLVTYPFTYPWLFSGNGFIGLLFTLFWLLWIGGSVERQIGSAKYAILCVVATVLPALLVWVGLELLHPDRLINDPFLLIGALTVAWGFRNPTERILLMLVIPITGFWIAVLTIGVVFFDYATPAPLLGFFAIAHLGVAWAFSQNKIPFFTYHRAPQQYKPSKAQIEKDARFMDDVRRRSTEREERERLRKLLESSIKDEDVG